MLDPFMQMVAGLLMWAIQATGYNVGMAPVPVVTFTTPDVMIERGELPTGTSKPLGVYVIADQEILLDSRLDVKNNLCARSVLVHELVHHVQVLANAFSQYDDQPYLQAALYEREAHNMMNLWLAENDIYRITPQLPTRALFNDYYCLTVPPTNRPNY